MLRAVLVGAWLAGSVAAMAQAQTTPSSEPSLVADWKALCASHHDDFAGALTAADAAGWMTAPDAMVRQFASGPLGKPAVRIKSSASGMRFMLVGKADQLPGVSAGMHLGMRYCGIGVKPADTRAAAELAQFAAVPPNPSIGATGGFTGYVYRETPTGRVPVLDSISGPKAVELVKSGKLDMILAKSDDGMSLALFAIPTSP